MGNNPLVSIIILNWNGLADTVECLESLKKITYPNYKVIVVDNASKNNEEVRLKEQFGNFIHLIKNGGNLGFAEGNNVGIRYALEQGVDYVLLLNNDTTVEPNFLDELVKTAEEAHKIGMVGARMMKYQNRNQIDNLGICFTKSGIAFNRKDESLPLFCPSGGCMLVKTKMLNDVELNNEYFDEDFFCYVEDLDLGFRGRLKGYAAKISFDAIIYHKGSASAGVYSDFSVYHGHRNIMWALIKNLPLSIFLKNSFWIISMQIASIFFYFFKMRRPKVILISKIDALKKLPLMLKKRQTIQRNARLSAIDQSVADLIFPK